MQGDADSKDCRSRRQFTMDPTPRVILGAEKNFEIYVAIPPHVI